MAVATVVVATALGWFAASGASEGDAPSVDLEVGEFGICHDTVRLEVRVTNTTASNAFVKVRLRTRPPVLLRAATPTPAWDEATSKWTVGDLDRGDSARLTLLVPTAHLTLTITPSIIGSDAAYRPRTIEPAAAPRLALAPAELAMTRGSVGSLVGSVRGSAGCPLSGTIQVDGPAGGLTVEPTRWSSAGDGGIGPFSVGARTVGRYNVTVSAPGASSGTAEVRVTSPARLEFEPDAVVVECGGRRRTTLRGGPAGGVAVLSGSDGVRVDPSVSLDASGQATVVVRAAGRPDRRIDGSVTATTAAGQRAVLAVTIRPCREPAAPELRVSVDATACAGTRGRPVRVTVRNAGDAGLTEPVRVRPQVTGGRITSSSEWSIPSLAAGRSTTRTFTVDFASGSSSFTFAVAPPEAARDRGARASIPLIPLRPELRVSRSTIDIDQTLTVSSSSSGSCTALTGVLQITPILHLGLAPPSSGLTLSGSTVQLSPTGGGTSARATPSAVGRYQVSLTADGARHSVLVTVNPTLGIQIRVVEPECAGDPFVIDVVANARPGFGKVTATVDSGTALRAPGDDEEFGGAWSPTAGASVLRLEADPGDQVADLTATISHPFVPQVTADASLEAPSDDCVRTVTLLIDGAEIDLYREQLDALGCGDALARAGAYLLVLCDLSREDASEVTVELQPRAALDVAPGQRCRHAGTAITCEVTIGKKGRAIAFSLVSGPGSEILVKGTVARGGLNVGDDTELLIEAAAVQADGTPSPAQARPGVLGATEEASEDPARGSDDLAAGLSSNIASNPTGSGEQSWWFLWAVAIGSVLLLAWLWPARDRWQGAA